MTEALALQRALMLANDLGLNKILFESDSLLLVMSLATKKPALHDWRCRHIILNIVSLMSSLVGSFVPFIPRDGNAAADCIAAEAHKGVYPVGWVSQPSLPLLSLLTNDANKSNISRDVSTTSNGRMGIG